MNSRQFIDAPLTATLHIPRCEHTPIADARGSPVLGLSSTTLEEFATSRAMLEQHLRHEKPHPAPTVRSAAVLVHGQTHAHLAKERRNGTWHHLARGWYSTQPLGDAELLASLREMVPDDVVIAGETAAMIYGVDVRPPREREAPFRLCLLRTQGQRSLRRPGIACRTMSIDDDDIVDHPRFGRIVTAVRAACDVAMGSTLERATAWIEGFLRAGLVTIAELRAAVDDRRGRRGVRTLRLAVARADPASESPQETAVRLRLFEAGLPRPQTQVRVYVPGESAPRRIDLAWPNTRGPGGVGLEFFGTEFHPVDGVGARLDEERLALLEKEGWRMMVVRGADLQGDERTFEREVAQLLGVSCRGGLRHPWSVTRTSVRRNAWTRAREPWWRRWLGRTSP